MEEMYANIEISLEDNELHIAEESSSGCSYKVNNKKDFLEYVLGYVLDCIDPEHNFDFELKES